MIVAIDDLYNLITYFYPSKLAVKPLEPTDARKLSLLCTVFLIGTLFDLDLDAEAIATQAELFHLLVRASLASHCFSVETTVEALQSLVRVVYYQAKLRFLFIVVWLDSSDMVLPFMPRRKLEVLLSTFLALMVTLLTSHLVPRNAGFCQDPS